MKVLVVGANGQIGKQVVEKLQDRSEHTVTAVVRKQEQVNEFKEKGIEAALLDLEGKVDTLTEAFTGADAIIFAAGSGGHTGPDKTLLIDLDGAVKTMEAAEAAGVERYILVSAYDADKRENWNVEMRPYYVAKHYADRMLEQSKLNYTIVRPGGLINENAVGRVTVGVKAEPSTITREDVADVLVASLEESSTYQKSFNIVNGTLPIKEALKAYKN